MNCFKFIIYDQKRHTFPIWRKHKYVKRDEYDSATDSVASPVNSLHKEIARVLPASIANNL